MYIHATSMCWRCPPKRSKAVFARMKNDCRARNQPENRRQRRGGDDRRGVDNLHRRAGQHDLGNSERRGQTHTDASHATAVTEAR